MNKDFIIEKNPPTCGTTVNYITTVENEDKK
jgi:hypothetical protein